jgi:hypothetical protein
MLRASERTADVAKVVVELVAWRGRVGRLAMAAGSLARRSTTAVADVEAMTEIVDSPTLSTTQRKAAVAAGDVP